MWCRDVMKSDVLFLTPQSTVLEAAALMRDQQLGFLPICDRAHHVVGVLTDRDIIVRVVADNQPADISVQSCMTPNVVTCRSDEDLSVAADLMGEMQISRIVCLNHDGELEGIISLSDLAHVGNGADAMATLRSVTVRESRV